MDFGHDTPANLGFDAKRLERITSYLSRCVDEGKAAGFGALIARRGKVAYEQYVGFKNLESKAPVDASTIFRIYSMSKPITCAAALSLWEEGAFGLMDPVKEYLPEFSNTQVLTSYDGSKLQTRPAALPLTIWNLFTHTAGIPYGTGGTVTDRYYADARKRLEAERPNGTTREVIEFIASLPLAFDPGTGWLYGFAHDIVGRLVEVLSGEKLSAFLQKRIFEPLGMKDTAFWAPKEKIDRLASIYDRGPGDRLVQSEKNEVRAAPPAFESGGSALLSTVGDYAKFCQMLLGPTRGAEKVLSPATIRLMATPQLSESAQADFAAGSKPGYGYGLGVRVMTNPARGGRLGSLGEFGWDGAASTWMCVDPSQELIAVLMLQLRPYASHGIADRFQRMLYAALE